MLFVKRILSEGIQPCKFVVALIFIGAVSLRLGLSNYNREANDPHMPVIRYIMKNDRLPVKEDCWECFQPKLFHYAIAKALSAAGLERRNDDQAQIAAAQMINFLAGLITLIVAWVFINKIPVGDISTRLLAFALLAFNPQLIGITSQVTNDTFLIMFCVLSVYFAYRFLQETKVVFLLLIIIFSTLAVSTKTNGWVVVAAISIALFIKSWVERVSSPRGFVYAGLYLLAIPVLTILNPLTQYVYNYQHYGSPILINLEKQDPPLPFEKTYIPYAGIMSIQDGFFTFKFVELIKLPITDVHDKANDATARTSLWTQLYGDANSIHFENYPPSWRTLSEGTLIINRYIFVLALIPTALILSGFALETFFAARAIFTKNTIVLQETSFGLFTLLFIGCIFFIALYAFEYRFYNLFKAIFIYPALLVFPAFFMKGLTTMASSPKMNQYIVFGIYILAGILIILYILDVASLIWQLMPNGSGINLVSENLIHIWR